MSITTQRTLFEFSYEEKKSGPIWLEDYDGNHRTIPRMDAEATVEYLHRVPAEKGSWWRCLVIDHSRSYNSDKKSWDAEIWLQRGIGIRKNARYSGEVQDCIDPHPYKWHYLGGKQIRPWKYEPLKSVCIEENVLHLTTESGEYMAQIIPNTEIDRYDLHPYQPDTDLEHFLMECIRHGVPKEMMMWTDHYVYATPALRPFSRGMTEEEIRKKDPMGQVPGALVGNEHFTQITDCARYIGMQLKLPHDVPALENLAMYPVEQTCRSCLHYKSMNKTDGTCRNGEKSICCSDYMWDRKTPAKKLKKPKPKEEEEY